MYVDPARIDTRTKNKDKDIRRILRLHLHEQNAGNNALIVNEFALGSEPARVDIALVTDEYLVGFEIKSASDTLTRLRTQVPSYGKVFDRMILVVDEAHVRHAQHSLPEWWGIAVAETTHSKPRIGKPRMGRLTIRVLRKSQLNPQVEASVLATLIWREEALAKLEELGKDWGVRSKNRRMICARLS